MGSTSSRRASTSPPTLTIPTPPFSACTTPSRSSNISPTLTPHTSPSPSMAIPQHVKGKTSFPLSNKLSHHMKRLLHLDSQKYEHTSAWYGCENTETHVSVTNDEYRPESSQYRQFQSTPRFETSSSPRIRARGTEGADHSPLTLPQPVTGVSTTSISRTIHIQPNPRLNAYFSRHAHAQDQSLWLSLEWILASRSATHGLFDAYPYHLFDAFLLRTDPTARPCLSFLHAEQSFRDKWTGWTPCHNNNNNSNTWKISIMVSDAKQLYQTYLIPIMPFLSSDVKSRLEDIGLNSSSIDPTQDDDVTLFIHGDMFLPAVHEIMNVLRTGPFQSFIQTRQYQELGAQTH